MASPFLSIALWEMFKSLVKPATLSNILKSYGGEQGLRSMLGRQGASGIKAFAEASNADGTGWTNWQNSPTGSNVDQIRYNPDQQKLQVMFRNGSLYEYSYFPTGKYQEFLNAPSWGIFVWEEIKGKQQKGTNYPYIKISGGNPTAASRRTEASGWTSVHHAPRRNSKMKGIRI
jgi:hypothetical protein